MSIFSKIKILDLTRVLSGPLATRHFADQGAEVIKVEPMSGDDSRHFPPIVGDWSGYFEVYNRNKKSLVIDLKSTEGLNQFYQLCQSADVIVENYSPHIKQKLKIDYETIQAINPKIIYASICGISKDNPRRYYDMIAQAESGLISLNNFANRTAIVDSFSGVKLAFAIASGLYNREVGGRGLQISVSLKGCAIDMLEQNLIEASVMGINPDTQHDTALCPFGTFESKTHSVALGIGNDKLWFSFVNLARELGCHFDFENYSTNQKRLNVAGLINGEIQKLFLNYDSETLFDLFDQANIPFGIVNTMLDVINSDDNYTDDLIQKVNIPNVGQVVVPQGGIHFEGNFANQKTQEYNPAPQLNTYYDV